MCKCIKASVEDNNFLREGWGCVNLMIFLFNLRIFTFWFDTEKVLFQLILVLLLLSINVCRLRERGHMSKSVYVRVVHDLELLRYVPVSYTHLTLPTIPRV